MTVVVHYKPNYDDSFIINKLAKKFARIEFFPPEEKLPSKSTALLGLSIYKKEDKRYISRKDSIETARTISIKQNSLISQYSSKTRESEDCKDKCGKKSKTKSCKYKNYRRKHFKNESKIYKIKYEDCNCYLEFVRVEDELKLIFKCSNCRKKYERDFDDLKK